MSCEVDRWADDFDRFRMSGGLATAIGLETNIDDFGESYRISTQTSNKHPDITTAYVYPMTMLIAYTDDEENLTGIEAVYPTYNPLPRYSLLGSKSDNELELKAGVTDCITRIYGQDAVVSGALTLNGEVLGTVQNNFYDFEGGCLTGLFAHQDEQFIIKLGYYYHLDVRPRSETEQYIMYGGIAFVILCCCFFVIYRICEKYPEPRGRNRQAEREMTDLNEIES